METLLSTFSGEAESQQNQDFFQDDNDVSKKKSKILLEQRKSESAKSTN